MGEQTPLYAPPTMAALETQAEMKTDPKRARRLRRIKNMRVTQSFLAALLSLAIAAFQARVYITYRLTSQKGGAWPNVPNTMPTILLFSVALAALIFDLCMLIAYMWPSSKFARWAVTIGGAAQYMISSTKTVSFAIAAIVSKTSFDFGNASGTNPDLWSYTCTDQAATMDAVIQADSNCNTQWASWGFALAQLAIEVFGWIISILGQLTKPKLTAQAMEERITAYSSNVNSRLNDATPQFRF